MQRNKSRFLSVPSIAAMGVLAFFVGLMVSIILPYVYPPYLQPPFKDNQDFLFTKSLEVINTKPWRIAFYIHISCSVFVLLAGFTQFSKYVLNHYPKLHHRLGLSYVIIVLILSAPSGFVMSLFANGGFLGKTSFIFMSLLWWWFTFKAYTTAKNKEWQLHGEFMMKSYALSLSAVTLRIYNYTFAFFRDYHHLSQKEVYIIIAYMSWTINLFIAAWFIKRGSASNLLKK